MIEKAYLQELIEKPEIISKLSFEEISNILMEAKCIFEEENLLLEFDFSNKKDEVYVIGDIHGNLKSLIKLIDIFNENKPKLIISLGDIVDRGEYQLECLIIILALKILKPNTFYILKGNHETFEMNKAYGFFYEFAHKFKDRSKFNKVLEVYNVMPICAIVNSSVLCLHGGIPEDVDILSKLKGLKHKNIDKALLEEIGEGIFQIMWNDPKGKIDGFKASFRGQGINFFGLEAFTKFMKKNNLDYLIRAHECFSEGFVWFFNNQLLSIFSAANYRGEALPNLASYAIIKNKKVIPKIIE